MAVVVSAMGGKPKVTDMLLRSVSSAAAGDIEGSEVRNMWCKFCQVMTLVHMYQS